MIATMAEHQDEDRPFMFVKLDIKNGFWRMSVSNEAAWNFSYILPALKPPKSIEDIDLVIP